MFDFPLRLPPNSDYDKLGLRAEATAKQINEAKTRIVNRVKAVKFDVERRLEALRNQARAELGKDADDDAIDRRAAQLDSSFRRLEEKAKALEEETHELNRMPLEKPESRLQYDQEHSPCALLKLAEDRPEVFKEARTALHLVRQELARFLAQQGEVVVHPSDLTRVDFTADFTPNSRLDGGGL